MTKAQLLTKIARMESVQDHLMTELSYLDQLLRQVGFEGGLETVKAVAEEIIAQAEEKRSNA